MRLIRYNDNGFTAKVFLIADGSNSARFITPYGISESSSDQMETYLNLIYSVDHEAIDLSKYYEYDFYTIDLLGYSEIYALQNNALLPILNQWSKLISANLAILGTNYLNGKYCYSTDISVSTGYPVTVGTLATVNMSANYFKMGRTSARLVNIAIPKTIGSSFMRTVSANVNNSYLKYQAKRLFPTTTYNESDFTYLPMPIGESFAIRRKSNLQVNVVLREQDKIVKSLTLLYRGELSDLAKLTPYADVSSDDTYLYIAFIYNANRTYTLKTNSTYTKQDLLSTSIVKIISSDMLAHAKSLGIVIFGSYMQVDTEERQVTLQASYSYAYVEPIVLASWTTSDFKYVDSVSRTNVTDANRSTWLLGNYMHKPLQVGTAIYDISLVWQAQPRLEYNNMHYFLLNSYAKIAKQVNIYSKYSHTNVPIEQGIDNALYGLDLPIVQNSQVFFKNLMYKFSSDFYDGKAFAVILRHGTPNIELLQSSINVALVITIDYGAYFSRTSIVKQQSYYAPVATDTSKPNNTFHSDNDGIENTYDAVKITDFYSVNATELLPINIQHRLPKSIAMLDDASAKKLGLPLDFAVSLDSVSL